MSGTITPQWPCATVLRIDGEAYHFQTLRLTWGCGCTGGRLQLEVDGLWCPLVRSYSARREQQQTAPGGMLNRWRVALSAIPEPGATCTIEITTPAFQIEDQPIEAQTAKDQPVEAQPVERAPA